MNGLPYYKAYPRDFIEGTVGMPFEVKAAYRVLLDIIYMRGGELPDDPRYISGVLGCSVRAWNKYRKALIDIGKIQVKSGMISNFRADKELEILRSFQDKQSENRSKSNKNNDLKSPRSNHTEPEPKSLKPSDFKAREARKNDRSKSGWVEKRTAVDALHSFLDRLDNYDEQEGNGTDCSSDDTPVRVIPAIVGGRS